MTPPTKFRKKPIVVEAMQYLGTGASARQIAAWANKDDDDAGPWFDWVTVDGGPPEDVLVHTMEGPVGVLDGDWIIKGIRGQVYPRKNHIFAETYEPEEQTP